MTNKISILFILYLLMGCSSDRNIKLSSPDYDPIVVKIKQENPYEPIQVNTSGGGIDLTFKTTYTAQGKQVFKVLLSNGKLETFTGYGFEADFYHYSKLLQVEYKSLDSINLLKYFNNPISWTSDDLK